MNADLAVVLFIFILSAVLYAPGLLTRKRSGSRKVIHLQDYKTQCSPSPGMRKAAGKTGRLRKRTARREPYPPVEPGPRGKDDGAL